MQTAVASSPGGFVAWVEAYGQIIGFFVQLVYFIVVAGAVMWAAANFSKLVKHLTAGGSAVAPAASHTAGSSTPIDEFVE